MRRNWLESFDNTVIHFFREYADEGARIAFFLIFVWFGALKVIGVSAAIPLVNELLTATFLSSIDPSTFNVVFGSFEMLIGIMALIPRLERFTFLLLGLHLTTTVMPLFLLPEITWEAFLVPTLAGQYIMKNTALLALGIFLFSRLRPMAETHSVWSEEGT